MELVQRAIVARGDERLTCWLPAHLGVGSLVLFKGAVPVRPWTLLSMDTTTTRTIETED